MAASQVFVAPRSIVFGVAFIALSTLLFEVLLTRIFAVTMWYHFGFLAISLALLGTAAAAVFCYLYPERLAGEHYRRNLSIFACLFAIAVPLAIAVHLNTTLPNYDAGAQFYLSFGLQLSLLFSAFFFSGMCISIVLFHYAGQISRVYFYDLAGAALGSLIVVPLLYNFSGLALVFLISAIAFLSAWLFGHAPGARPIRHVLLVCIALSGVLVSINDAWGLLRIVNIKSYASGAIQHEEVGKVFERWSPVSRVAVFAPTKTGAGEMMSVTADAGAPTVLRRFDGDFSKMKSVANDFRQAAQYLKKDGDILIIGSAGGTDVVSALMTGRRKITAVEINPVIGYLVKEKYADYIGRIFHDPRVTLHIQEGRNFVAGSPDKYDIIQITMIDSWAGAAAGAYLFNEASLYTTEAIHDYVTHLKPGGVLSITRYYAWDEALRLTHMIAEYLRAQGIEDVEQRISLILENPDSPAWPRVNVLLKNGPYSREEAAALEEIVKRCRARLIYAPHVDETKLFHSNYADFFLELLRSKDRALREAIVFKYPRDITPATDDRPFFFFTAKLSNAFENSDEHAARRMAIPVLYSALGIFTLASLLTVFLPLYLKSRQRREQIPYRRRSLIYFAMLGVGFMLFEISLIQRLTVFLGHPTWSFVVVLSTLLFSSGIGSLFSGHWPKANPKVLSLALMGTALLILLYFLFIYDLYIKLMYLSKAARIILSVLMTAPVGFLMGMCFPMGMRIARVFSDTLIPWGWGVNGVCSVFASILAVVTALNAGFKTTLAGAALCYTAALLITQRIGKAALEIESRRSSVSPR